MAKLSARILQKHDTLQNWQSQNPVLLQGEIGVVDTEDGSVSFVIGNGTKHFLELNLFASAPVEDLLEYIYQE